MDLSVLTSFSLATIVLLLFLFWKMMVFLCRSFVFIFFLLENTLFLFFQLRTVVFFFFLLLTMLSFSMFKSPGSMEFLFFFQILRCLLLFFLFFSSILDPCCFTFFPLWIMGSLIVLVGSDALFFYFLGILVFLLSPDNHCIYLFPRNFDLIISPYDICIVSFILGAPARW